MSPKVALSLGILDWLPIFFGPFLEAVTWGRFLGPLPSLLAALAVDELGTSKSFTLSGNNGPQTLLRVLFLEKLTRNTEAPLAAQVTYQAK